MNISSVLEKEAFSRTFIPLVQRAFGSPLVQKHLLPFAEEVLESYLRTPESVRAAIKGIKPRSIFKSKLSPFTLKTGRFGLTVSIPQGRKARQINIYRDIEGRLKFTTAAPGEIEMAEWARVPFSMKHPTIGRAMEAGKSVGKGVLGAAGLGAAGLSFGAAPIIFGGA